MTRPVLQRSRRAFLRLTLLLTSVGLLAACGGNSSETNLTILQKTAEKLESVFTVATAPFGWYKEFNIHVKGHPLAELSREF